MELYRRLTNVFSKQKSFVLKTVFFIHGICMCEGVGENSGYGIG